MYASTHAAVGTAIVGGGYLLAGPGGALVASGFAVASHLFVDQLNEKPYGDKTVSVVWEAIPLCIFAACAYLSGVPWVFAFGWIAGNLMDIIDKKLYLAMFFDSVKPWNIFHKWKPAIDLDLPTTQLYAFMSCVMYVLIALVLGGPEWTF
jgi:hypothetical protein